MTSSPTSPCTDNAGCLAKPFGVGLFVAIGIGRCWFHDFLPFRSSPGIVVVGTHSFYSKAALLARSAHLVLLLAALKWSRRIAVLHFVLSLILAPMFLSSSISLFRHSELRHRQAASFTLESGSTPLGSEYLCSGKHSRRDQKCISKDNMHRSTRRSIETTMFWEPPRSHPQCSSRVEGYLHYFEGEELEFPVDRLRCYDEVIIHSEHGIGGFNLSSLESFFGNF